MGFYRKIDPKTGAVMFDSRTEDLDADAVKYVTQWDGIMKIALADFRKSWQEYRFAPARSKAKRRRIVRSNLNGLRNCKKLRDTAWKREHAEAVDRRPLAFSYNEDY